MSPVDRRAAIVAATAPLVREHGRAVTTRQIAGAAGVAEGTIFRVFADKQAVVDAVIAGEFDERPMLAQLHEIELDLPLAARIEAASEIMHRRIRGLGQLMYALSTTSSADHLHRTVHHRGQHRDTSLLHAELRRLLEPDQGSLSVDVDTAVTLVAAMAFAVARAPVGQGQLTTRQMTDALLHGILRPARAAKGR